MRSLHQPLLLAIVLAWTVVSWWEPSATFMVAEAQNFPPVVCNNPQDRPYSQYYDDMYNAYIDQLKQNAAAEGKTLSPEDLASVQLPDYLIKQSAAKCDPAPDLGAYALYNAISAVDVLYQGFSKRDWERWDSWDVREDAQFTPTRWADPTNDRAETAVWGYRNGQYVSQDVKVWAPGSYGQLQKADKSDVGKGLDPQKYLRAYQATWVNTFYPRGYKWFRGYGNSATYDLIQSFKSNSRFWSAEVMINVSYALNENYINYRSTKKASLRAALVSKYNAAGVSKSTAALDAEAQDQFDQVQIDWLKDMPRNQASMDWFERYVDAVMAVQCLTVGTIVKRTPSSGSSDTIDAFGLFSGFDGTGYNQNLAFFYYWEWAYQAGRYLKLMRSSALRKVRKSMMAQASAMYANAQYRGNSEDRLASQWSLRMTGWTTTTYVLIRSEQILRARGDWVSTDGYTTTNWGQGQIANADMIAKSHQVLDDFVVRMEKYGLTEYLSTYYGFVMDVLATSLYMAPDQYCYDRLEKIIKMFMIDQTIHYLPGAGAYAGASGRHYDAATLLHSKQDLHDTTLMVNFMYPTQCAVYENYKDSTGTMVETVVNVCTEPSAIPTQCSLSIGTDDFNMKRAFLGAFNAAGLGWIPLEPLINVTLGMPYRQIFSRSSDLVLAERLTFIHPDFLIGFGGEETWGVSNSIPAVARLAGSPVANTPVAMVKQAEPTRTHANIRLMFERSDTPFYRDSTWGTPSHDQNEFGRWAHVIHHGWMLTTGFISGNRDAQSATDSFNTDLFIPLTVDTILADNTPLGRSAGTVVALPPGTIFTVRHGKAAFVIRIIRLETSGAGTNSNIKTATSITPLSNFGTNYDPGKGIQEYCLMWQVDSASRNLGAGRLTMHHKHSGTTETVQAWRVSFLIGGGATVTDPDLWSLQRTIKYAKVSETITADSRWDMTDQPWNGATRRTWDKVTPFGSALWTTEVTIGSKNPIKLKVQRRDNYTPDSNYAAFKHRTAPVNAAPYYMTDVIRAAQGTNVFDPYFTSGVASAANMAIAEHPLNIPYADYLQPHMTEPITCTPGVDANCYQWTPSAWSACSATCGTGTHTRTVKCMDATANKEASSTSYCQGTAPATQEACVLPLCPPSAPAITGAVPKDKGISVSFTAPTDNGGGAITLYTVSATETGQTTAAIVSQGAASPIQVGPLTNGKTYTVKVAAANADSQGPWSTASSSLTPDSYQWVYSDWGACSAVCNGGTQTRTVTCKGTTAGTSVADNICPTAKPTDLSQACNAQPCKWVTTDWSTCSNACSGGTRTRTVSCTTGTTASPAVSADASLCPAASKPTSSDTCNTQACVWSLGTWSTCPVACGGGTQTRSVDCTDGLGNVKAASVCTTGLGGSAPASSQQCNTAACKPNQWTASAWSTCSAPCNGGTQTRTVSCQDASGKALDASQCAAADKPSTQQSCNTASCNWVTGTFGDCSAKCNGGTKTRTVVCQSPTGSAVAAALCTAASAPASTQSCNTAACVWNNGAWGTCSVSCGTGTKTRSVDCRDASGVVVETALCLATKPATADSCDTGVKCVNAPSTPKIRSVEAGDKKAKVYFDVDASSAGAGYIVQAIPQSTGPIAQAFDIGAPDGSTTQGLSATGTESPITVVGLVNGVSYAFTISAYNSAGSSPVSTPSAYISPYGPPTAPAITTVDVVDASAGQVKVSFTPGTLATGEPASTFVVVVNVTDSDPPETAATMTGSTSPITVSGLKASTKYTVLVFAENPVGDSVPVQSPLYFEIKADVPTTGEPTTPTTPSDGTNGNPNTVPADSSTGGSDVGGENVQGGGGGGGSSDSIFGGDSTTSDSTSSSISGGAIAGIVIACAVCLIAIIVAAVMWRRRQTPEEEKHYDISLPVEHEQFAHADSEGTQPTKRRLSATAIRINDQPEQQGLLQSSPMGSPSGPADSPNPLPSPSPSPSPSPPPAAPYSLRFRQPPPVNASGLDASEVAVLVDDLNRDSARH